MIIDWIIHKSFDEKRRLCNPAKFVEFVFDHSAMMMGQGDRHEILRTHKRMYRSRFLCLLRLSIQFMFLCFAFLCFVMSSLYTAELTNLLIKREPKIVHKSFSDMIEQRDDVLVPSSRIQYFQNRWNVNLMPYSYENTTYYQRALELLLDGDVSGIVGNRATLLWLQKQDTKCTVSAIPESDIGYYGPVIAWSACVNPGVIDDVNLRIVDMEMDGTLEDVASSVIRDLSISGEPALRECVTQTTTIGVPNVSLVFIILGASMCLPFLLVVCRYVYIFGMSVWNRCAPELVRQLKVSKSVKSHMDSSEGKDGSDELNF